MQDRTIRGQGLIQLIENAREENDNLITQVRQVLTEDIDINTYYSNAHTSLFIATKQRFSHSTPHFYKSRS